MRFLAPETAFRGVFQRIGIIVVAALFTVLAIGTAIVLTLRLAVALGLPLQ